MQASDDIIAWRWNVEDGVITPTPAQAKILEHLRFWERIEDAKHTEQGWQNMVSYQHALQRAITAPKE